jgi:DNA-binding Lrp family transcriptional regulator
VNTVGTTPVDNARSSVRVKRALRARGVITGIHASIDMAKMGRPVKGMVTVRLRPQSREIVQGFRDFVIRLPQTLQVFVTTGSEDLLILVAVESTEALRDFVLDSLTKRREGPEFVPRGCLTTCKITSSDPHSQPDTGRFLPTDDQFLPSELIR